MEKVDIIATVCRALASVDPDGAVTILKESYPFAPERRAQGQVGPVKATRVFMRDGFIDRYSGKRLIFPPVLRVISLALPAEFPYDPHWNADVTHPAYWDLSATIDHVIPKTRGGSHEESNLVTTSMVRNGAKMHMTLDELGWQLYPPGSLQEWDGLLGWFVEYAASHAEVLKHQTVRGWYKAAQSALQM